MIRASAKKPSSGFLRAKGRFSGSRGCLPSSGEKTSSGQEWVHCEPVRIRQETIYYLRGLLSLSRCRLCTEAIRRIRVLPRLIEQLQLQPGAHRRVFGIDPILCFGIVTEDSEI